MLVKYHVASSAALSGGLYVGTGSWELSAAAFAGGVMIDGDHTLEYLVEHGMSLDIRRFFRLVGEARYRRVFYFLHSWELLCLTGVAAWAWGWNPWTTGFLAGFALHLVLDQLGNRGTAGSYFILWRWTRGFDHARCFPGHAARLLRAKSSNGVGGSS
jgi:hypothetical protein